MTDETKQNELLEIYKLHAELADRVSQRREGANRLYVSLLLGLVALLAALLRFGVGDLSPRIVVLAAGIVGALLSVSWYIVLRSYRQLNTGKFLALHELEKKIAYPFFQREWDLLGRGADPQPRRYWRLTVVETFLPAAFFVLSCVLMLCSAFS